LAGHAGEQPLTSADCNRSNVQPQLIDMARPQVLIDRGRTTGDRHITIPSSRLGLLQRALDAAGDEGRQFLDRPIAERLSSDWLGPATYPSTETVMSQYTLLMNPPVSVELLNRLSANEPAPRSTQ
jgi:hypothetical protein